MNKNIDESLNKETKNIIATIENKFSFTCSLTNDGSSNLEGNPSNTTTSNIISPRLLNFQLLVRNKTHNGNFDTTIPNDVNIGDLVEFKYILTNTTQTSLSSISCSILFKNYHINYNIFEFIDAQTPSIGLISGANWYNITLTAGQTEYAICTFQAINSSIVRLEAQVSLNYDLNNPNSTSPTNVVFMNSFVNFKIAPGNIFSFTYSKNNYGTIIEPNTSPVISLNILSPNNVLKVQLLARNKTTNSQFVINVPNITTGTLIEFKIILTNIGSNTINNISACIDTPKNIIEFTEVTPPSIGSTEFQNISTTMGKLSWSGIPSLAAGESIESLSTFKVIEGCFLEILAKANFPFENIPRYMSSYPVFIYGNPENQFSLIYAKVNDGSSNIGPNISNTTFLTNVYYYSYINVNLFIRNKTLNENFVTNLYNIDAGTIIEFKIFIKNFSNSLVLKNTYTFLDFPKNILEYISSSLPTNDTISLEDINSEEKRLTWDNKNGMGSYGSISAILTFKIVGQGKLKLMTKVTRYGAYFYSPFITITTLTPPTIKKEQRIYSADGGFTEYSIDVVKGEIIQYRLTVSNPSSENFYSIKITDVLDSNITYLTDSITDGNGHLLPNSKFISPAESGTVNGKIEWIIDILKPTNGNNSIALCFRVTVN